MNGIIFVADFSEQPLWWNDAAPRQPGVFEGLAFKTRTLYAGKPWFLPIISNWWRLRDWIEISRARQSSA